MNPSQNPNDIKINLQRAYPVPPGFADRVMARIVEQPSPGMGWLWNLLDFKWELAAAAFASIFVAVYSAVSVPAERGVFLLAHGAVSQDELDRAIFDDEE